jgi:hypothetical protein
MQCFGKVSLRSNMEHIKKVNMEIQMWVGEPGV